MFVRMGMADEMIGEPFLAAQGGKSRVRVVIVAAALGLGCVPAPTRDEREPPRASAPVQPQGREPSPPAASAPAPVQPPEDRPARSETLRDAPRHRPEALSQAPRPTRIEPGIYQCRISKEYRLRDCKVERDAAGHVMLTMPAAMIAVRGVLWDEGDVTKFAGWTTAERPFGCFACQERCAAAPHECACIEHPIEASRECLAQPVRFELRGGPKRWRGVLEYRTYFNDYKGEGAERRVVGYGSDLERLEVELQAR